MKIVLAPSGSRGDVYPLIYLGRELKKQGHDIHIATSPDYREICEKSGFQFYPAGSDFKELMDIFTESMGKPLKVMKEGIRIFNDEIQAFYDVISKVATGADMLFASGLQFPAATIAELHNIPYRYMAHIPILIPSKYHPPYFVPFQNLPKWLNSFLWNGNNFVMASTVGKTLNKIRVECGLKPRKRAIDHFEMDKIIIAVSPELGKIAPDNTSVGAQIDYIFNPNESDISEDMLTFLEEGDAPVYFGFGSMTDPHPEKTLDVIIKSVRQLGLRAIISRGWAKYSHDDNHPDIFFAGEEPHGKLFPKMKAIVHHGGAGTTSNASRAGVPQITTPHVLDQYYWTHRIKTLGVSPGGINKHKFNVKTLTEKLKLAIEDDSIKMAAKELREQLKDKNGLFQLVQEVESVLSS